MASHSRVGEILLEAKVLDELQLRSARAHWEKWGGRLGKSVAELGLADDDTIADAICKATSLPRIQLGTLPKDPAALAKFDVRFSEEHGIFPVAVKDQGKTLVVAMADPTDLPLFDAVAQRARAPRADRRRGRDGERRRRLQVRRPAGEQGLRDAEGARRPHQVVIARPSSERRRSSDVPS